jgi:ubiquinone/menaquinone biosynthesis C-methylase UbiE
MPRTDTIFERFLAPIVKNVLIDQDALRQIYESIDWPAATGRFTNPQVNFPDYYAADFHGIANGYLNIEAAISYDAVTQYALPPNEGWVRQALLNSIQVRPRRILDLGTGTGSMALLLQQAFPDAEVIGLDLSPPMLAMAEYKAQRAHDAGARTPQWRHGNAAATGLAADSFDLVTAALLFHETPPDTAQAILVEAHRLLRTGGEILILDGNQKALRQADWLTQIFEEPYIQDYAQGSLDAFLGSADFSQIRTEEHWLVHQVTGGVKGRVVKELFADLEAMDSGAQWAAI